MRGFLFLGAVLLPIGLLAACEPATDHFGAAPSCTGASNCISPGEEGHGTTSSGVDGGSGGGNGSPVDVTGTIERLTSPAFDRSVAAPFAGLCNVIGPSPTGTVSAPYGGTGGSANTFTLKGVKSGNVWLEVQDLSNGGSDVLSTLSEVSLPAVGPITLPVMDLGTLQNIGSNLPDIAISGISTFASQIVIQLQHDNAPYAGVHLESGATGVIAYDQGFGIYADSSTANATGPGGTILVFNSGASGTTQLVLKDTATQATFTVAFPAGQGAITLASFSL